VQGQQGERTKATCKGKSRCSLRTVGRKTPILHGVSEKKTGGTLGEKKGVHDYKGTGKRVHTKDREGGGQVHATWVRALSNAQKPTREEVKWPRA